MYFKLAVHYTLPFKSFTLKSQLSKDIFTESQIKPHAGCTSNSECWRKYISLKIIYQSFLQQVISIYHKIIILSEAFSHLQKLSSKICILYDFIMSEQRTLNIINEQICRFSTFQMNQKTQVNSEILTSTSKQSQSKTYYLPKIVKFCNYRP